MIRWLIGSCMICLCLSGLPVSPAAAEAATGAATDAVADADAQSTSHRLAADAKPTLATPVNINTATAQELDGLPGIGAKMAQRIVDYRQKNGPFKKLEDVMGVQG